MEFIDQETMPNPLTSWKFWKKRSAPESLIFPPHEGEARGFVAKDAFADQRGLVQNASTIFDVGAYTGDTAAQYLKLFPDATIYAFEPFEPSFLALQAFAREKRNLRPFQLAITDRSGPTEFYSFAEGPYTNSLLPADPNCPAEIDLTELQRVGVQATTLDEFCVRNGVGQIDILKMDIQGGELRALEGASKLLLERAIRLIYTEILFVPLYRGQAWHYEIASFLSSFGYALYDFYNFSYADTGPVRWGDAIFLPGSTREVR